MLVLIDLPEKITNFHFRQEEIKKFHQETILDKKSLMLERIDKDYVYNYDIRKRDSVFKSYYGDIIDNKVVRKIL